jgi:hypothetical protein
MVLSLAALSVAVGCDRWVLNDYRGQLTTRANAEPLAGVHVVLIGGMQLSDVTPDVVAALPRMVMYGGRTDSSGHFSDYHFGPMTSPINPPVPALISHSLLWVEVGRKWHLYEIPVAESDQVCRPGEIHVRLPTVRLDGAGASVGGRPVPEASFTAPSSLEDEPERTPS